MFPVYVYDHDGFLSFRESSNLATVEQVFDCPRDQGTIWDAIEEGDILVCKNASIAVVVDEDGELELELETD